MMQKSSFSSKCNFNTEVGHSLVNARNGNEFYKCEQSHIRAYNTKILYASCSIYQVKRLNFTSSGPFIIYVNTPLTWRKKPNLLPNWHKLNPNKTSKLYILATKSPPDIWRIVASQNERSQLNNCTFIITLWNMRFEIIQKLSYSNKTIKYQANVWYDKHN